MGLCRMSGAHPDQEAEMTTSAVALVAAIVAADPSAAERTSAMEPADSRIARAHCSAYLRVNGDGRAEKEFPTKTGTLIIAVRRGAVRAVVTAPLLAALRGE